MNNRRRFRLTLCCLLVAMVGFAQKAKNDSIWREMNVEAVVVTGTRTPKLLKDAPVQTRVITSREIERTDATNIMELLQQELPGVEFSFAMNQMKHLNFAGFGGQGVLFLIDGERLAGETLDDVDFTRLSMDNIERVEIVRGAASALYGSNANGGVVNVITKENAKALAVSLDGRLARHNEQRYGGTLEVGREGLSNALNVRYSNMDNYDVRSDAGAVTRVVTTIYGDRTWNINDKFSLKLLPELKLTAKAGFFFREMVRSVEQPERFRDYTAGLRGVWDISKRDALEMSYNFDQYDKSDYQRITRYDIRDYSNVQNTVRGLYNHSYSDGSIMTMGADYMHDYLYSHNLEGDKRQQDCLDAFVQYDWIVNKRWELVGAIRYDYFSDGNNSHFTPRLNARYKHSNNLSIRFGYGMGYRAPTLKEKYNNFDMSGIWIVEGNKNLRSEVSHNFNASAEYTKGRYNINVSAYYNKVKDKLATSAPYFKHPTDKVPYLPYNNLDDYCVYGGEISALARWSNGISARISYAYTKEELPKDKDGKRVNNQYIPARKHTLTCRMDYDHQFSKRYGISASINGRMLSAIENMEFADYYDVSKGTVTVKYPAYMLWKLSLVQRIGQHLSITAAIDNLLNYKPDHYYLNAPLTDGANLQIGAKIEL